MASDVTRYVDGLDGDLAVSTGKTGGVVVQVSDLHGDITATVPVVDGQATVDVAALLG